MHDRLVASVDVSDVNARFATLEINHQRVVNENAILRRQLSALKDDRDTLLSQMNREHDKNERIYHDNQLDSMDSISVRSRESESSIIEILEMKLQFLEDELIQARSDADGLRFTLDKQSSGGFSGGIDLQLMATLRRQVNEARAELTTERNEKHRLLGIVDNLERDLMQQRDMKQTNEIIKHLKQDLVDVEEELKQSLEDKERIWLQSEQDRLVYQGVISELESSIQETKTLSSEHGDRIDKAKLHAQMEILRSQLSTARRDQDDAIASTEHEHKALILRIAQLELATEEQKFSLSNEILKLKQDVINRENAKQNVAEVTIQLENKLKQVEASYINDQNKLLLQIDDLRNQLTAADEEKEAIEIEYRAKNYDLTSKLEDSINCFETNINDLTEKCEELRNELLNAEKSRDDSLSTLLHDKRELEETLDTVTNNHKSDIRNLELEMSELQYSLEKVSKEAQGLNDQRKELTYVISQSEAQRIEERQYLEQQIKQLSDELELVNSEKGVISRAYLLDNERISDEMRTLQQLVRSLTIELENANNMKNLALLEQATVTNNLKSKESLLISEVQQLRQSLDNVKYESNKAVAELDNVKKELENNMIRKNLEKDILIGEISRMNGLLTETAALQGQYMNRRLAGEFSPIPIVSHDNDADQRESDNLDDDSGSSVSNKDNRIRSDSSYDATMYRNRSFKLQDRLHYEKSVMLPIRQAFHQWHISTVHRHHEHKYGKVTRKLRAQNEQLQLELKVSETDYITLLQNNAETKMKYNSVIIRSGVTVIRRHVLYRSFCVWLRRSCHDRSNIINELRRSVGNLERQITKLRKDNVQSSSLLSSEIDKRDVYLSRLSVEAPKKLQMEIEHERQVMNEAHQSKLSVLRSATLAMVVSKWKKLSYHRAFYEWRIYSTEASLETKYNIYKENVSAEVLRLQQSFQTAKSSSLLIFISNWFKSNSNTFKCSSFYQWRLDTYASKYASLLTNEESVRKEVDQIVVNLRNELKQLQDKFETTEQLSNDKIMSLEKLRRRDVLIYILGSFTQSKLKIAFNVWKHFCANKKQIHQSQVLQQKLSDINEKVVSSVAEEETKRKSLDQVINNLEQQITQKEKEILTMESLRRSDSIMFVLSSLLRRHLSHAFHQWVTLTRLMKYQDNLKQNYENEKRSLLSSYEQELKGKLDALRYNSQLVYIKNIFNQYLQRQVLNCFINWKQYVQSNKLDNNTQKLELLEEISRTSMMGVISENRKKSAVEKISHVIQTWLSSTLFSYFVSWRLLCKQAQKNRYQSLLQQKEMEYSQSMLELKNKQAECNQRYESQLLLSSHEQELKGKLDALRYNSQLVYIKNIFNQYLQRQVLNCFINWKQYVLSNKLDNNTQKLELLEEISRTSVMGVISENRKKSAIEKILHVIQTWLSSTLFSYFVSWRLLCKQAQKNRYQLLLQQKEIEYTQSLLDLASKQVEYKQFIASSSTASLKQVGLLKVSNILKLWYHGMYYCALNHWYRWTIFNKNKKYQQTQQRNIGVLQEILSKKERERNTAIELLQKQTFLCNVKIVTSVFTTLTRIVLRKYFYYWHIQLYDSKTSKERDVLDAVEDSLMDREEICKQQRRESTERRMRMVIVAMKNSKLIRAFNQWKWQVTIAKTAKTVEMLESELDLEKQLKTELYEASKFASDKVISELLIQRKHTAFEKIKYVFQSYSNSTIQQSFYFWKIYSMNQKSLSITNNIMNDIKSQLDKTLSEKRFLETRHVKLENEHILAKKYTAFDKLLSVIKRWKYGLCYSLFNEWRLYVNLLKIEQQVANKAAQVSILAAVLRKKEIEFSNNNIKISNEKHHIKVYIGLIRINHLLNLYKFHQLSRYFQEWKARIIEHHHMSQVSRLEEMCDEKDSIIKRNQELEDKISFMSKMVNDEKNLQSLLQSNVSIYRTRQQETALSQMARVVRTWQHGLLYEVFVTWKVYAVEIKLQKDINSHENTIVELRNQLSESRLQLLSQFEKHSQLVDLMKATNNLSSTRLTSLRTYKMYTGFMKIYQILQTQYILTLKEAVDAWKIHYVASKCQKEVNVMITKMNEKQEIAELLKTEMQSQLSIINSNASEMNALHMELERVREASNAQVIEDQRKIEEAKQRSLELIQSLETDLSLEKEMQVELFEASRAASAKIKTELNVQRHHTGFEILRNIFRFYVGTSIRDAFETWKTFNIISVLERNIQNMMEDSQSQLVAIQNEKRAIESDLRNVVKLSNHRTAFEKMNSTLRYMRHGEKFIYFSNWKLTVKEIILNKKFLHVTSQLTVLSGVVDRQQAELSSSNHEIKLYKKHAGLTRVHFLLQQWRHGSLYSAFYNWSILRESSEAAAIIHHHEELINNLKNEINTEKEARRLSDENRQVYQSQSMNALKYSSGLTKIGYVLKSIQYGFLYSCFKQWCVMTNLSKYENQVFYHQKRVDQLESQLSTLMIEKEQSEVLLKQKIMSLEASHTNLINELVGLRNQLVMHLEEKQQLQSELLMLRQTVTQSLDIHPTSTLNIINSELLIKNKQSGFLLIQNILRLWRYSDISQAFYLWKLFVKECRVDNKLQATASEISRLQSLVKQKEGEASQTLATAATMADRLNIEMTKHIKEKQEFADALTASHTESLILMRRHLGLSKLDAMIKRWRFGISFEYFALWKIYMVQIKSEQDTERLKHELLLKHSSSVLVEEQLENQIMEYEQKLETERELVSKLKESEYKFTNVRRESGINKMEGVLQTWRFGLIYYYFNSWRRFSIINQKNYSIEQQQRVINEMKDNINDIKKKMEYETSQLLLREQSAVETVAMLTDQVENLKNNLYSRDHDDLKLKMEETRLAMLEEIRMAKHNIAFTKLYWLLNNYSFNQLAEAFINWKLKTNIRIAEEKLYQRELQVVEMDRRLTMEKESKLEHSRDQDAAFSQLMSQLVASQRANGLIRIKAVLGQWRYGLIYSYFTEWKHAVVTNQYIETSETRIDILKTQLSCLGSQSSEQFNEMKLKKNHFGFHKLSTLFAHRLWLNVSNVFYFWKFLNVKNKSSGELKKLHENKIQEVVKYQRLGILSQSVREWRKVSLLSYFDLWRRQPLLSSKHAYHSQSLLYRKQAGFQIITSVFTKYLICDIARAFYIWKNGHSIHSNNNENQIAIQKLTSKYRSGLVLQSLRRWKEMSTMKYFYFWQQQSKANRFKKIEREIQSELNESKQEIQNLLNLLRNGSSSNEDGSSLPKDERQVVFSRVTNLESKLQHLNTYLKDVLISEEVEIDELNLIISNLTNEKNNLKKYVYDIGEDLSYARFNLGFEKLSHVFDMKRWNLLRNGYDSLKYIYLLKKINRSVSSAMVMTELDAAERRASLVPILQQQLKATVNSLSTHQGCRVMVDILNRYHVGAIARSFTLWKLRCLSQSGYPLSGVGVSTRSATIWHIYSTLTALSTEISSQILNVDALIQHTVSEVQHGDAHVLLNNLRDHVRKLSLTHQQLSSTLSSSPSAGEIVSDPPPQSSLLHGIKDLLHTSSLLKNKMALYDADHRLIISELHARTFESRLREADVVNQMSLNSDNNQTNNNEDKLILLQQLYSEANSKIKQQNDENSALQRALYDLETRLVTMEGCYGETVKDKRILETTMIGMLSDIHYYKNKDIGFLLAADRALLLEEHFGMSWGGSYLSDSLAAVTALGEGPVVGGGGGGRDPDDDRSRSSSAADEIGRLMAAAMSEFKLNF